MQALVGTVDALCDRTALQCDRTALQPVVWRARQRCICLSLKKFTTKSKLCTKAAQQEQIVAKQTLDAFEDFILNTQESTIQALESLDASGKQFHIDRWERDSSDPNAGYGITAVLEDGNVIEKGAVNITVVKGKLSPQRAKAMSSRGRKVDAVGGDQYSAAAMSLVVHSAHPFIPTLRADVRVFQVAENCWYGGGCDLTPSYIIPEDCRQFHEFWKTCCDKYGPNIYAEFKGWCDSYFYIPARKEHRGIGGIFFDDLQAQERGFDVAAFTSDVGEGIVRSWEPIVDRLRGVQYSQDNRQWQLLRRGRYLEFNLLYDRGVKFGLDGGRVESIMVSAPPLVAWKYNVLPQDGTPEAELLDVLRVPREWV